MIKFLIKNMNNTIPVQSCVWKTARFSTTTDTIAGVSNSSTGIQSPNGMRYHFVDNNEDQILKIKIFVLTGAMKFFDFNSTTIPADSSNILINRFLLIPINKTVEINYPIFNFGFKRVSIAGFISVAALIRKASSNNNFNQFGTI